MTRNFKVIVAVTFLLTSVAGVSPLWAQRQEPGLKPLSEDQLIAKLSSPDEDAVLSAMTSLKLEYRGDANAVAAIKKLLTDSRFRVRDRAAGTLGAFRAAVNAEDVQAICALLKENRVDPNLEALKALRSVQGPAVAEAVPEILPFLKNANTHLMRDACRTLAVIGHKDLIPQIEPLLTNPNLAVRKDAQNAIASLRSKP